MPELTVKEVLAIAIEHPDIILLIVVDEEAGDAED